MQKVNDTLYTVESENDTMDDEMDALFDQLAVIQPPADLAARICSSILQLPPYPQMLWHGTEELIAEPQSNYAC